MTIHQEYADLTGALDTVQEKLVWTDQINI